MKFNIVGLFVNDKTTMVTFYRDVMGLPTDWDGQEPNVVLQADGFRLIMFSRSDFEKMTSYKFGYPQGVNGTVELAFEAEDYAAVDREYEHVVRLGATPIMPPTTEPWGQRTSFVADPDGNLIEIGSFNKGEH
jgi:catechol 2,3-dioxygenase-like lactoylglutathione lyase family enzyme